MYDIIDSIMVEAEAASVTGQLDCNSSYRAEEKQWVET